jgi:hypothetical protein
VKFDRTIGRLFRAVCSSNSDQIEAQLSFPIWASERIVSDTVDAAAYHAIVPLVAEALLKHQAPTSLQAEMLRVYRSQAAHVLRLEVLLKDVGAVLELAGVPFAVFKGAALAHGYHGNPLHRTYADVDVLVCAEDLDRVDLLLRDAGYLASEPTWRQALSLGYGETLYLAPNGTALDLHWHPIREPAIRRAFSLNTRDLLDRARTHRLDGRAPPSLDAEDMLVVVCAHACYDGAYRLGWMVDVARIEQSGQVRWDVLNDRCTQTGLGLPVQIVLDRARHALRYIPSGAPLQGGVWRGMMSALSAVRPIERSFGQAARGGVVFRSTRRSALASLRSLGQLAVIEVVKPLVTDPEHRWRQNRQSRDRSAHGP